MQIPIAFKPGSSWNAERRSIRKRNGRPIYIRDFRVTRAKPQIRCPSPAGPEALAAMTAVQLVEDRFSKLFIVKGHDGFDFRFLRDAQLFSLEFNIPLNVE
jgi:hypothetical protein